MPNQTPPELEAKILEMTAYCYGWLDFGTLDGLNAGGLRWRRGLQL
jgi:hypothetical protein